MKKFWLLSLSLATGSVAYGQNDPAKPRTVPLTRPEMKRALEDMKDIKPRFELPEPTKEEIEKAGERGLSYEGRLRSVYLNFTESRDGRGGAGRTGPGTGRPGNEAGGTNAATGGFGPGRDGEPGMTLSYAFKTQLFWIVSRTNNCLY